MNLTDIAKKIINEDSWGMNPSAGGGMSLGRSPSATNVPAPTSRRVDISKLIDTFRADLDKHQKTLIDKLAKDLKNNFANKTVIIKASKGSVGQIEKEYKVAVSDIDIFYQKDFYYVVFIGKEGNADAKEYYLSKHDNIVQVDDAAQSISNVGRTGGMSVPEDGTAGKKNILPQG